MRLDESAARARRLRPFAPGILAVALAALPVLPGCGSDGAEAQAGGAEVAWVAEPEVYRPPSLPRDRILQGEVVAKGSEEVELRAEDLRLLDPEGRELEASAAFISGYAPSIEPLNQLSDLPEDEERRIGRLATVGSEPVPLTVSWTQPRGSSEAAEIELGAGRLPVPNDS
jgi:hypothetical protein